MAFYVHPEIYFLIYFIHLNTNRKNKDKIANSETHMPILSMTSVCNEDVLVRIKYDPINMARKINRPISMTSIIFASACRKSDVSYILF
jgi:hypothetical protein